MWNNTRVGWLMALAASERSAWGYVPDFYADIRNSERRAGHIIIESDVWGKHLHKNHHPEAGEGLAFYHSTKARFAAPDPFHRRPRISLVGEILDVKCGSGQVDSFTVAVDDKVLDGLERRPIIKNEVTNNLFRECGIGTGAVATFYPVNHKIWARILQLTKATMVR